MYAGRAEKDVYRKVRSDPEPNSGAFVAYAEMEMYPFV